MQKSKGQTTQNIKSAKGQQNSNIASAKVQRSNYPKYQECKRSTKQQYCKCKSPKVKLPKISRVQKVENQIVQVLLTFAIFAPATYFVYFVFDLCTLDILGSLIFGLLHLQYCCLIVLSCLDCHTFFTQCFNSSVPRLENWSTDDYNLDPSCCLQEFLCTEEEVIDLLFSLNTTT